MRHLATFIYWIAAVLSLAFILMSFEYAFGRSLFLASALLPGMLCAKFFLPMAVQAKHRRILSIACVVSAILMIEWLALLLTGVYTSDNRMLGESLPPLFSNPVFILVLLTAFVVPEELLSRYLKHRIPDEKTITFISERRKITLPISAILFIESNDKEVLLHTSDACYRTRTGISQWARLLDDRFVRIHRAYLVNAARVTGTSASQVSVGVHRLNISRKYRETVALQFSELIENM